MLLLYGGLYSTSLLALQPSLYVMALLSRPTWELMPPHQHEQLIAGTALHLPCMWASESAHVALQVYCMTRPQTDGMQRGFVACTAPRLMPYLYSLMWQAAMANQPPLRPLFYDFESDDACFEDRDQLMLGEALMAAPVLQQGVRQVQVGCICSTEGCCKHRYT